MDKKTKIGGGVKMKIKCELSGAVHFLDTSKTLMQLKIEIDKLMGRDSQEFKDFIKYIEAYNPDKEKKDKEFQEMLWRSTQKAIDNRNAFKADLVQTIRKYIE